MLAATSVMALAEGALSVSGNTGKERGGNAGAGAGKAVAGKAAASSKGVRVGKAALATSALSEILLLPIGPHHVADAQPGAGAEVATTGVPNGEGEGGGKAEAGAAAGSGTGTDPWVSRVQLEGLSHADLVELVIAGCKASSGVVVARASEMVRKANKGSVQIARARAAPSRRINPSLVASSASNEEGRVQKLTQMLNFMTIVESMEEKNPGSADSMVNEYSEFSFEAMGSKKKKKRRMVPSLLA